MVSGERETWRRVQRICSLVPSATEIVCALGLAEQLVGVSHECDYPPCVQDKAVLTWGTIDVAAASGAIDAQVSGTVGRGESLYGLDAELLARLAPDLILTQALCAVCAVSVEDVRHIAGTVPSRPQVLSLDPHDVAGILASIQQVASTCGVAGRGAALVAHLEERMAAVATRVGGAESYPTVLCLEWLDPPYCAGHWIPEMVALAGGRDVLGRPGARSARLAWSDLLAVDPDVIVVMCCGFSVERTLGEIGTVSGQAPWARLRAVREGQVYVVDGAAYFSRPGPRVAAGVELMAACLHPALAHHQFSRHDVCLLPRVV
jgi:iron complex transport system substrate-binding protein